MDELRDDPPTSAEVAAIRHLVGLSADAFAAALEVNPRTVRGWESGKYAPGPSVAAAIWELLDEHTAEVDRIAATDGPLELPGDDSRPRGWWLAAIARVLDRDVS